LIAILNQFVIDIRKISLLTSYIAEGVKPAIASILLRFAAPKNVAYRSTHAEDAAYNLAHRCYFHINKVIVAQEKKKSSRKD
jgi:hypothetical protein